MSSVLAQTHWRHGPWVAMLGAIVLAIGLFLLIPLTQLLQKEDDAEIVVRQVLVIQPPSAKTPPPPDSNPPEENSPPPQFEQTFENLSISQLELAMSPGASDALAMTPTMKELNLEVDVMTNIEQIFTFEDLPEAPRLVSIPRIQFPNALVKRGMTEGTVVLQVVIGEDGRVEVEKVISATARELQEEAVRVARRARFAVPEIGGEKVKVRGEWPLKLQAQ